MWIPARARVPPRFSARSAGGTSSPAGAKRIAESVRTGISAGSSPTQAAPIAFASSRWEAPRVQTYAVAPRCNASCRTMWAEEPKP